MIYLIAYISAKKRGIVVTVQPGRIPIIIIMSIISILILNTSLIPMHEQHLQRLAYAAAEAIPKTSDMKRDVMQHNDEQNSCHRGEDCRQADEGQQIEGNENSAAGLNDQSKNIEQEQNPGISVTPPVTPDVIPSTLTVAKDVTCNFTSTTVDCPTADIFSITVSTGNGSSYTFSGSESGTPLTINPPFPVTYLITETSPTKGFVIAIILVGDFPEGIAFNPDNGNLYVANSGDDTVSVIAPLTTTFSDGCNGTIESAGQSATCTVTNTYGRP
jgi:hypothetical protein